MKRLSLFIALVALIAFSATAQQSNLHPRNTVPGAIQKTGGEKKVFHLNIQRPTTTDTIGNLQPCDSLFYIWTFTGGGGFLSGHNAYIDSAKAERFQGAPGDHISGLWVFFGDATYTNTSTQKCHLKVWDDNGAGNTPGTVLGNVDRTHKSIADDIAAGNLTTVYFTTPLAMPSGGNFYAGVQLDYKLKQGTPVYDSTRIVTLVNSDFIDFNTGGLTECGDTSLNTAWEKWSDGTWHSYVFSYGFGTRNPVFPIVTTTTGCTITITPASATICKGKKVTLKATGATTYSWAPSTGLNCTTCATVSAKPTATTTYTVTGDGGACSKTATVTVNASPSAGISQGACSGGAILLTRTGTPTTGVKFQWIKNSAAIPGATNSTYSATSSGTYQVKVTITSTGCNKTSQPATVTINCKQSNDVNAFEASVYPNPFTQSMSVNIASGSSETATVVLLDLNGRTVHEFKNVDVSSPFEINEELNPGVYFVKVIQGANQKMIKVVKD